MRVPKGVLIVFEGIDGTGKSTQLELLAKALREKGYPVVSTREPTDGPYGKKIRNLYVNRNGVSRKEELELFLADRREHVENLLLPALGDGKIVLCDRYYLSTIAYQGAAGFDLDEIMRMNSFAPQPDLALIFQATPATSIERITKKRGDILNDFEQVESLAKVATVFESLDLPYVRRIDATGTIESIHASVIEATEKILLQNQHCEPK